jgi:L-ascorbate metabolism protein UlaG (beta-lactamase superfamily)
MLLEVICMHDKQQLINALVAEYQYLCHDDFDPDVDTSPEEYLEMLKEMSYDELVEEANVDEEYTLEEYLETWT